MEQAYAWRFFRAGGVDQVSIRTGQDIKHLAELDQKLWVALACPTRGIELDPATLDLIDQDGDGRIRAPELLAACRWAVERVKDPEVLASGADVLQLSSLCEDTEEGAALLAEARRILAYVGRPHDGALALADVQQRRTSLHAMHFNGDGLLNPQSLQAHDAPMAALVQQILDSYGATEPPKLGVDGQPGMDRALMQRFFADVQALVDWHQQETACALGDRAQAVAATQALNAVQAKIEDFFTRTRLAAFDARALAPLSPSLEGYAALGQVDLHHRSEAIAALPLAPLEAEGKLPLRHGLNPAWSEAMARFEAQVVQPLLGPVQQLSLAQWQLLQQWLAPCQAWLAACPVSPVAAMPLEQAQALLAEGAPQRLAQLLDEDEAEKAFGERALALEKLIRLQRDLLVLLNNFVSFAHFYRREGAAFQAGTLFLDGRSCDLTVDVANPGAHAALAGMAKMYLAYCECRRKGEPVRHIVAAFTAGDVDFLFVGRNGVFYDRQGRDWDATITKLIDNPTSIGQAFFSPYKKFLRMVEEQVAKRAAAQDGQVHAQLGSQAGRLVDLPTAAPAAAAAAPAPAARKTDVGTVAAIGVALGSLSAVAVGIFAKFIELGPWIPVALLGMVLAISGPSMVIAWLKLRQRSLGPILDASGWAINGRMTVNLGLGNVLSQAAKVPAAAQRALRDPFAQPRRSWRPAAAAVAAVVLVLALGWQQHWWRPAQAHSPVAAPVVQGR